MLLSILREKPDAIYVAWDAPGPTFRDELFEAYKAHRPEADPDLKAQFQPARELVEAFGIPSAEVPGFEADDLIGALAEEGLRNGYDVLIYTGDSDQLQLVRDGVTVRMTTKGVSQTTDYGIAQVVEKYGVRPDQIADFKALVGDSSDNIPGVPGVGAVTAARLLQEWGSLENLLNRVEELPEKTSKDAKIKAALREHADQARLARTLTGIRSDAPVDKPLKPYAPSPETWAAVRRMFESLEFRSLLQRLCQFPGSEEAPPPPPASLPLPAWKRIQSEQELRSLVEKVRHSAAAAVRLHTDGGGPLDAKLLGVAVALGPSEALYVPVRASAARAGALDLDTEGGDFAANAADLKPLLCQEGAVRWTHDAKPVLQILARHGIADVSFAFDTALAAYLLSPGSGAPSLPRLVEQYLRVFGEVPKDPMEEASYEAARIAALMPLLTERVARDGLDRVLREIELPLIPVLAGMERKGVCVDRAWLQRLSADMERRLDELARQIYEEAGEEFLISSTQQLQRILFDKLNLPAGKRTKTGRTTAADHLEMLAAEYPIARHVLQYREIAKLKSTYADALPRLIRPDTGRVHTTLNQMVTSTGRLSSSDPNLQNIPVRSEEGRQIRKAFVAPAGRVLLSCDYSQIELRVFAHVTEDAELMRAFEADEDIHTATATKLFGVPPEGVTPEMRRRAKTVNFAVIYGQSAYGLAQTLGIPNEEARTFIENYFRQFPGVRVWTTRVLEEARQRGYVETLMGRRRYLPDLHHGNRNVREAAERAAVNMPIQGTAADIMKKAMLAVWEDQRRNKRPWELVLQVHDELLLEVDSCALQEAAATVTKLMEEAYRLRVRLKVDARAGLNWADMEPV